VAVAEGVACRPLSVAGAGELPRLFDDANGYGPAGRDYIAHVDFPDAVLRSWEILRCDTILTDALTSRSLI
jgi:hypothetical protein